MHLWHLLDCQHVILINSVMLTAVVTILTSVAKPLPLQYMASCSHGWLPVHMAGFLYVNQTLHWAVNS